MRTWSNEADVPQRPSVFAADVQPGDAEWNAGEDGRFDEGRRDAQDLRIVCAGDNVDRNVCDDRDAEHVDAGDKRKPGQPDDYDREGQGDQRCMSVG